LSATRGKDDRFAESENGRVGRGRRAQPGREPHLDLKSEIRSTKYETNPKYETRMTKTRRFEPLNFVLWICFGFRASYFVLPAGGARFARPTLQSGSASVALGQALAEPVPLRRIVKPVASRIPPAYTH